MIERYHLLLIDDDEDEFVIIEDLLHDIPGNSYEMVWVRRFDDALDQLRERRFDVALVDHRLGPESGIELVEQVTKLGVSTPLIVLTGQERRDIDVQAMKAGAADYLIKGQFDSVQLERAIRYTVERSRARVALQENKQRLDIALHAARIGTWDWNIATDEIIWSDNIREILGLDMKALAPTSVAFSHFVHPDDLEIYRSQIMWSLGNAQESQLEYRVLPGDDSIIWVEARGKSVRDDAQRAIRMIGTIMDITRRKQVGEALRVNEERLRTVISNMPVILFALDRDGNFTLSEGKGLDSLGLSSGEVLGTSMREMYHSVPRIVNNIDRALEGETVRSSGKVGDLFYQSVYSPLLDDKDQIVGLIGVAVDVTEFKMREIALTGQVDLLQARNQKQYEHLQRIANELNQALPALSADSRSDPAVANLIANLKNIATLIQD